MMPPTASKGMKAEMVVNEELMTGANMRRAPPSAACKGSSPVW